MSYIISYTNWKDPHAITRLIWACKYVASFSLIYSPLTYLLIIQLIRIQIIVLLFANKDGKYENCLIKSKGKEGLAFESHHRMESPRPGEHVL